MYPTIWLFVFMYGTCALVEHPDAPFSVHPVQVPGVAAFAGAATAIKVTAASSVVIDIFMRLVIWVSPVLCFAARSIWKHDAPKAEPVPWAT